MATPGLSTRKVAEEAGVPVSQLNYHFGSKQGLILALFGQENQRRLARQTRMYGEDRRWQRYERACDFSRTIWTPAMCGFCRS